MIVIHAEQFGNGEFVGRLEYGGTVRVDIRAGSLGEFVSDLIMAHARAAGMDRLDPAPLPAESASEPAASIADATAPATVAAPRASRRR